MNLLAIKISNPAVAAGRCSALQPAGRVGSFDSAAPCFQPSNRLKAALARVWQNSI